MKLNWTESDVFTVGDWNRIVRAARERFQILGIMSQWEVCPEAVSTDLPYYTIVNALESNLAHLSEAAKLQFASTVWYPVTHNEYTHNPSYQDFNRWEELLSQISIEQYTITDLRAGTFRAGTDRVKQTLERGV